MNLKAFHVTAKPTGGIRTLDYTFCSFLSKESVWKWLRSKRCSSAGNARHVTQNSDSNSDNIRRYAVK
jgi:hypothetical protein